MKAFIRFCCLPLLLLGSLTASAQIPLPAQRAAALSQKLRTLILPELTFQDATLEEAIEFLRLKCAQIDSTADPSKRGINIVLLGRSKAKLSLQLKNTPVSEALRYITELTGRGYIVEPYAIVIGGKNFKSTNPPPRLIATHGIEAQAQNILLPSVQFQKASPEEACEYMRLKRSDVDPPRPMPNIVLKAPDPFSKRQLSLDLKNIPQSEALRYIAELSGLHLRYQAEAVLLSQREDDLGKIELLGKATEKLRADKIILPLAQFQNATLEEVATFVRIKSAEADPAKNGINIIIAPGTDLQAACSLDVRHIRASEMLRYAAGLMDLKISADDHAFTISAK
ncbi:MAG: hypothetical protein IPK32_17295 [Verrucomicrobiaceae bacterium]|nr:hypothetical protein [Verrucomicrobiaceae bacterium]